jgi:Na+/H+ antiporter NhaC
LTDPDVTVTRTGRGFRWHVLALGIALVTLAVLLAGRFPTNGVHYGIWSIVPPLVTLVLAFALREVITALFVGIVLGGVISGELNIVQAFLIPSVGSENYALILLVYLWSLGGLIGLWTKTGGAQRFAEWAGKRVATGPRSAKLFAWVMGLVFHQGGTISTVLTGTTVRPVSDAHRVAHEELAYIVDSTASPAATLIPFNVWPIYVGGLVAGSVPVLATQSDAIGFFFRALPFNFYAIFAILFTFLFAGDKMGWLTGRRMRTARQRARETGALDRPGATPMAADDLTRIDLPIGYRSGLIDFFAPIGTLLGVAIGPFAISYFVLGQRESSALSLPIAEAFVLAVLVGVAVALVKGMRLHTVIEGLLSGWRGVTIGAVVLALAVTLKSVADGVGTAPYIVETFGSVPPVILPAALLFLCMLVAFSTGTSWGTYAVIFPVAMPLAWAVHPDATYLALCFGAVTGGSVFGDQCSPISDTTILSSLATGCDLMDHVLTQLPLALAAATLGGLLYVLVAAILI